MNSSADPQPPSSSGSASESILQVMWGPATFDEALSVRPEPGRRFVRSVRSDLRRLFGDGPEKARILLFGIGSALALRDALERPLPRTCRLVVADPDPDALPWLASALPYMGGTWERFTPNVFVRTRDLALRGPFNLVLSDGLFELFDARWKTLFLRALATRWMAPEGTFLFSYPRLHRSVSDPLAGSETHVRRSVTSGFWEGVSMVVEPDPNEWTVRVLGPHAATLPVNGCSLERPAYG